MDDRVMRITAEEARRHGLPGLGFHVDLAQTVLHGRAFPRAETYLELHGPPGGPLGVIVLPFRHPARDVAAIQRAVREHVSGPAEEPLLMGAAAALDVAGASRTAVLFLTGRSHARTAWCAALVAPVAGEEALLLLLGVGMPESATVDLVAITGDRDLGRVIRTFRWE